MAGVFTKYPAQRYHKDLAPEGRTVRSAAEEDELGPGWVDTPAAFAAGYVPMTEDPPEGTPFETYVAPIAPPIAYPALRYARDGSERTIASPAEEAAGWQDHPWSKSELAEPSAEPPPATADDTGASVPGVPPEDGLHRVTVEQVEEVLAEIASLGELDAIEAREARNPRGARKGVLAAIEARREALAAARA